MPFLTKFSAFLSKKSIMECKYYLKNYFIDSFFFNILLFFNFPFFLIRIFSKRAIVYIIG